MLTHYDFAPFLDFPEDIVIRTITHDEYVEQNWADILSPLETQRRNALSHPGRKRGFTLGRVALRTLLADQLEIPAKDVPLLIEPSGQLSCPDSGLHLSLAHSGDKAIAAVAPRTIGVDLEEVRTKPDALLDYILAESEKRHIYDLDIPDSQRLFLCWTLKESVLKALGVGLRSAPRKVQLQIDVATKSALITDPDGRKWNARYAITGPWVSAIAF